MQHLEAPATAFNFPTLLGNNIIEKGQSNWVSMTWEEEVAVFATQS